MLAGEPQPSLWASMPQRLNISVRVSHTHLEVAVTSKASELIFIPLCGYDRRRMTIRVSFVVVWQAGVVRVEEFAESFEVLWRRHVMHQIGDVGRLVSIHVEKQGRMGMRRGEGGKVICLLRPRIRIGASCIVWTYPVCIAGKLIFEAFGNWKGGGGLSWLRLRALPEGVGEFDVDLTVALV
jgi:hypothetical protein